MLKFLLNTLKWIIQQSFSVLRFAWPHAIRLVFWALGISMRLSALAIVASVRGTRPVAEQMAKELTKQAILKGFPILWEIYLFWIFYYLAIETIFAGWALILFTFVFTLDIAYHLIF